MVSNDNTYVPLKKDYTKLKFSELFYRKLEKTSMVCMLTYTRVNLDYSDTVCPQNPGTFYTYIPYAYFFNSILGT